MNSNFILGLQHYSHLTLSTSKLSVPPHCQITAPFITAFLVMFKKCEMINAMLYKKRG